MTTTNQLPEADDTEVPRPTTYADLVALETLNNQLATAYMSACFAAGDLARKVDSALRLGVGHRREALAEACTTLQKALASISAERPHLHADNMRLLSLVRLQRAELHEQNAITDDEYAQLCERSDARIHLETHDDLREQLRKARCPDAETAVAALP